MNTTRKWSRKVKTTSENNLGRKWTLKCVGFDRQLFHITHFHALNCARSRNSRGNLIPTTYRSSIIMQICPGNDYRINGGCGRPQIRLVLKASSLTMLLSLVVDGCFIWSDRRQSFRNFCLVYCQLWQYLEIFIIIKLTCKTARDIS